jgi:hypothetical protein
MNDNPVCMRARLLPGKHKAEITQNTDLYQFQTESGQWKYAYLCRSCAVSFNGTIRAYTLIHEEHGYRIYSLDNLFVIAIKLSDQTEDYPYTPMFGNIEGVGMFILHFDMHDLENLRHVINQIVKA